MLLLGYITENTNTGVYDTDYGNVSHQRCDILAEAKTSAELKELYEKMTTLGKISREKLSKLEDEIEYSDISEKEYDKKCCKLLKDIKILKYDRIIIVEGNILK